MNIKFKHPTENYAGCGHYVNALGYRSLKIKLLDDANIPDNIYINVKSTNSQLKSKSLPIKLSEFKEKIKSDYKILIYDGGTNIWISLGVMEGNQFLEFANENKNKLEKVFIPEFEFVIEYSLELDISLNN